MSFTSDSEEDYGDEQLTSGDDDNYAFASHEESTTRQVLSLASPQVDLDDLLVVLRRIPQGSPHTARTAPELCSTVFEWHCGCFLACCVCSGTARPAQACSTAVRASV